MIRQIGIKETVGNSIPRRPADKHSSGEVDITHRGLTGKSIFEEISIWPGIKMIIADRECRLKMHVDFEIRNAPISFCYSLSQRVLCTINNFQGKKKVTERLPGESVFAYLPNTRGTTQIIPNNRIEGVSIHFDVHAFYELFSETPQCLKDLYSAYNDSTGKCFYHQSRINGEILFILKQILRCPYAGEIRRLYLETKSLELVALKLAELGQNGNASIPVLTRKDLERTKEAYHILIADLDRPPSLCSLSRRVGINRNKLNRGFREIYGDTVFNVLRNVRLSKAWSLLNQTDLSLSEIALSVGYNNQANFTTAFRKQFGKTPKTVRKDSFRCFLSQCNEL
jgi:AraC family transcriptional regulator, transcriptional activator of the genes for pyochelin and ferripyochelin receptors